MPWRERLSQLAVELVKEKRNWTILGTGVGGGLSALGVAIPNAATAAVGTGVNFCSTTVYYMFKNEEVLKSCEQLKEDIEKLRQDLGKHTIPILKLTPEEGENFGFKDDKLSVGYKVSFGFSLVVSIVFAFFVGWVAEHNSKDAQESKYNWLTGISGLLALLLILMPNMITAHNLRQYHIKLSEHKKYLDGLWEPEVEKLKKDNFDLRKDKNDLTNDKNSLTSTNLSLTTERDTLKTDKDALLVQIKEKEDELRELELVTGFMGGMQKLGQTFFERQQFLAQYDNRRELKRIFLEKQRKVLKAFELSCRVESKKQEVVQQITRDLQKLQHQYPTLMFNVHTPTLFYVSEAELDNTVDLLDKVVRELIEIMGREETSDV